MKIVTIKDRIKKAESKLTKLNGTLERHNSQLVKKSKVLTDKGVNLNNYDKFDRSVVDHDTYWDLCDYEHKLEDIENTTKKIQETTKTLENLKEQLADQLAKDEENNNLVPEVLNIFLENWKRKCIEFYTTLAKEYITLVAKEYTEYEITREELDQLKKKKYNKNYSYEIVNLYNEEETEQILSGNIRDWEVREIKIEIRHRHIETFKSRHFASDMVVLYKIIEHDKIINNIILNNILDEDVKIKKEMFIRRIKEVIGEIKDLSNLKISGQGEINGIAKGLKANAKVETITAGGYNIQCWHYRVLVNTVK